MLCHVYVCIDSRWLRSSNALLYDPALRRTLHTYMKKLYIQLIAEFKTLGCIIVFANFNKIIVCTKKRSVADALGYMEFVVQTIRNKELFHSIEITYDQCWEYLIWLDLVCYLTYVKLILNFILKFIYVFIISFTIYRNCCDNKFNCIIIDLLDSTIMLVLKGSYQRMTRETMKIPKVTTMIR